MSEKLRPNHQNKERGGLLYSRILTLALIAFAAAKLCNDMVNSSQGDEARRAVESLQSGDNTVAPVPSDMLAQRNPLLERIRRLLVQQHTSEE